ncbi:hypothetical protein GCM10009593_11310 [Microlunatus antarcticus]
MLALLVSGHGIRGPPSGALRAVQQAAQPVRQQVHVADLQMLTQVDQNCGFSPRSAPAAARGSPAVGIGRPGGTFRLTIEGPVRRDPVREQEEPWLCHRWSNPPPS